MTESLAVFTLSFVTARELRQLNILVIFPYSSVYCLIFLIIIVSDTLGIDANSATTALTVVQQIQLIHFGLSMVVGLHVLVGLRPTIILNKNIRLRNSVECWPEQSSVLIVHSHIMESL